MGFKKLIVILIILFIFATYIVGMADKISMYIEKYSEEKFQEPTIEKIALYNMKYTYFTAKYKRTLELIEKYLNKYQFSKNAEEVYFLKAKTYDRMLEDKIARQEYKNYIDNYPDGKYKEAAERRYKELMNFY